MPETKMLNCSFCGKSRDSVERLIAGPNVYICNECIVLSYNIVQEGNNPDRQLRFLKLAKWETKWEEIS